MSLIINGDTLVSSHALTDFKYDLVMLGTMFKNSSVVSQFCFCRRAGQDTGLWIQDWATAATSSYSKLFLILKPRCVWVSTSSSPLSRINTWALSVLINNLEWHTLFFSRFVFLSVKNKNSQDTSLSLFKWHPVSSPQLLICLHTWAAQAGPDPKITERYQAVKRILVWQRSHF